MILKEKRIRFFPESIHKFKFRLLCLMFACRTLNIRMLELILLTLVFKASVKHSNRSEYRFLSHKVWIWFLVFLVASWSLGWMLSWVLPEVAKHRKKRSTCMQRHRYFLTQEYARILVSLSFCQTPGCYCRQKRPCWPEGRKSFGRWQSCHCWPEALLCLCGAGN